MNSPFWVTEQASSFWDEAGYSEPFPRALIQPIATGLPLTIVMLPKLRITSVEEWLLAQRVACRIHTKDRELRACLVARYGQGIAFVDGSDPPNERRISIAHELAHFLIDYWQPRRAAVDRLGPEILEVLDGLRFPRSTERAVALLARIDLDFRIHLMDRTDHGEFASITIESAESDADCLAYELLAPALDVHRQLEQEAAHSLRHRDSVSSLLMERYGFPGAQADRYSRLLVPDAEPSHFLLRRLNPSS